MTLKRKQRILLASFLAFWPLGALAPSAEEEGGAGKAEKAEKPSKSRGGKADKAAQKKVDEEFQKLRDQFDAERKLEAFERLETIVKFGDVPSKQTTDFLSKLYEEEKNIAVISAITRALGKIGTADAVKSMLTSGLPLLSEHAEGFDELQAALSRRLDPKAEEWLIKNGLSPAVREKPEAVAVVIKIIGKLRWQAKIDVLLAELKKSQPDLQMVILGARMPHADEKVAAVASHLARAENPGLRIAACDVIEASGSTKYKQIFIAGLKDPHWEMRVLSVDALGKLKDKDLTKHAVALLKDKDERVQVAAVQALLLIGGPDAVDALIKGMDAAKGRVLDDIADVLARMTKKNLGPIKIQWEGWWAQNKDKVKDFTPLSPVELAKLKEEESKNQATAAGTPFYFGLRVLTSKVAFAIDCSESMNEEYKPKEVSEAEAKAKKDAQGTTSVVKKEEDPKDEGGAGKKKKKKKKKALFSRLDLAKQEVLSVVKGLKDGEKLDILRFDTNVSDLVTEAFPPENAADKKALLRLDPKVRLAAEKYVKAAQPEGLTNLMGVIRQAFQYDEVDTIFLLSDGAPTVGIIDHDELLAEVARLNRRRKIKINVISFNPQPVERKLLQALSERNYGVYVEK